MRSDRADFDEKRLGKAYDFRLLRRLLPFARPYRLLFAASILMVVLITLLDLALPYVTKIAIDRYIVPQETIDRGRPDDPAVPRPEASSAQSREDLPIRRERDLAGLGLVTAAFLALVVLNFVFNFCQVMIMEYSGQKIMHDLRMRLFSHILGQSVSFFNHNPVGRLVTRATNDTQNMYELFTSIVSFVFKDLFLLAGIAAVLFALSWKLALAAFAVLPLVALASVFFSIHAREVFRTLRIKIAEINTRFSETIGGIRVIQLFRQERSKYGQFSALNHENYLAEKRQIHILALFLPAVEILGTTAVAVVLYYGGLGVVSGDLSLGGLVAFISYVRMFFRPLRDIAEKYNILQSAMSSAERIFLILDSTERLPVPERGVSPSGFESIREIAFEDVSFAYVPEEPVLKGVSFRLRRGEILAVVGPTGSGKTSLIQLLIRFYDPTSGRILVNGRDLRGIDPVLLRAKTALVTQDPFLFSGTIRENIFQGETPVTPGEIDRILSISSLKPMLERLPEGLDTVLSEGGSSISSGERQLIAIARAFARNPELTILDEATSYIDSETEQRIQRAVFKLIENRTSIIIAHRLNTARRADRILVLHRGKIIESGNHAELMLKRGFYARLIRMQNGFGEE
jgi:ATP-binding cassette subfamily B protein